MSISEVKVDIDKHQLFIRQMKDLEISIHSNNEFGILKSVVPIRNLLIDGSPLVHQVKKEFRVGYSFEVGPHYGIASNPIYPAFNEPPYFATIMDGLDPDMSNTPIRSILIHDQFLHILVAFVNRRPMSVLQILEFMSYVDGVLHAGAPRTIEQLELKEMQKHLSVGDMKACVLTLRGIARVVYKGLLPIRDAILRKYPGLHES